MKKAKLLLSLVMILAVVSMVLFACGDNDAHDCKEDPKTFSFSGMNEDVKELSVELDSLKSLEDMTGVNPNLVNKSNVTQTASGITTLEQEERLAVAPQDLEGYEDCTTPGDWYYKEASGGNASYFNFRRIFETINKHYNLAKEQKNKILESSKLQYFNVWYQDGFYTNRVTYNEETNDLICESYQGKRNYVKLNVGKNAEGKLYYSYFSVEFTAQPQISNYNGLEYQVSVEYLEDSYYNSYEITRSEVGLGTPENMTMLYQYNRYCYEVDLSVEGGVFYNYCDIDYYEKDTLKRYDYYKTMVLEEGEEPTRNDTIYCFWVDNGTLVEYRFGKSNMTVGDEYSYKGVSVMTQYGYDVMDIYSSDVHGSTAGFNLYEMDGVEKIWAKKNENSAYDWDWDFEIEFKNGKQLTDGRVSCNYYMGSNYEGEGSSILPYLNLDFIQTEDHIKEVLSRYGLTAKSYNLDKIIEIFNNPTHKIGGYLTTTENVEEIVEYFLAKNVLIDLEKVKVEYENVEDIKVPAHFDVAFEIEGSAKIIGDQVDLSGVKLIIANSAYIVDKDLKKLDLYYNGAKVGKLDFEYENNAFTFENVEKTKFEQNKFNRNEDYKMTIKVAKLGIEVEIPYVIEA